MNKRKSTQDVVADYIKMYSDKGVLTKSLMDIAEDLGYSNATIHRAIKQMEKDGLVEIIPSDTPRKPNTIVYQGEIKEAVDILQKGELLLRRMHLLIADVEQYVDEASRIIEYHAETIDK